MSWKDIVIEKKGKIIKQSEDIFSEHTLSCKNSHVFNLYANDILLGDWCKECSKSKGDTLISDILTSLSIPYRYNEIIEGLECDYVIEISDKKYIIMIVDPAIESTVQVEGWNTIIYHEQQNIDIELLKSWIWEAIKNNKKHTVLPPVDRLTVQSIGQPMVPSVDQPAEKPNHGCDIETILYQAGSSEVCSITKEALKPYPINVNHGVGYIRVSTKEQARDGFSLEAQEKYILDQAKEHNIFLKKIYIDRGISGGSTDRRAALAKMREELKCGEWVIICYVSRMARNTIDLLSIADEIEKKGCHFLIGELKMDITSSAGKLVLSMMASQAQFEREQVSEKVRSVIKHLKDTGKFRSKPPIGWMMNPDRNSIAVHIRNEDEMKVIKRIRNLRNKFPELKITAFTRKVNESKIKSPRSGKNWHHPLLKRLMLREGMDI